MCRVWNGGGNLRKKINKKGVKEPSKENGIKLLSSKRIQSVPYPVLQRLIQPAQPLVSNCRQQASEILVIKLRVYCYISGKQL